MICTNISNAIDAFDESNKGNTYHEIANIIKITTELSPDLKQVLIYIKDNGFGMSQALQRQIFNDFFTILVLPSESVDMIKVLFEIERLTRLWMRSPI